MDSGGSFIREIYWGDLQRVGVRLCQQPVLHGKREGRRTGAVPESQRAS